jgi:hypothetical protein
MRFACKGRLDLQTTVPSGQTVCGREPETELATNSSTEIGQVWEKGCEGQNDSNQTDPVGASVRLVEGLRLYGCQDRV